MPSPQHRVLTRLIPVVRGGREVTDPELERQQVLAAQLRSDPTPRRFAVRGCTVDRLLGYDFPVFEVRPRGSEPTRTLLYLHGGGYVSDVDWFHWRYVARLARRLEVRVVVPSYPLAPRHTWRDAHPALLRLFQQLAVEAAQGVGLVGDSAGGGLALALAAQIARRSGPQPTHLGLIAPWVDLTNSVPGTVPAVVRDPWLRLSRMRLYASWWAGREGPAAPEVSPLFGELAGLPQTLVQCGTRDLLCPQARELVRRARVAGTAVSYQEEEGLLHVYPLLPVPEASGALDQMEAFLRD